MATHAQNHTHYLPHELVWEILSWLPVKSLMRFKCVSRIWLSIIMDPSFATAHPHRGGRGRRGFLVPTDDRIDQGPRLTNMRYFFYVNLDDDDDRQVVSRYLSVTPGSNRMGITGLVNGLICFYNRNYSCLYNVATREALQLAVSNNDSQACSYHFGFDPVNKLYKLLKICPVYDGYNEHSTYAYEDAVFVRHLNCEVLTIGVDSSWRIIDPPPHREIKTRGVCLGGRLYWMEGTDDGDDKGLIGFDLVEEKFQVVPLPGLMLDDFFYLPCCGPSLVLFLVSILDRGKVEALMMARGGEKWGDEQKFIRETSYKSDLAPGGILPNGKLLIIDGQPEIDRSIYIYLYDQSKRVLEKQIVISLAPPFSAASRCIEFGNFLYFEENIILLSSLFTSTTTTTTTTTT